MQVPERSRPHSVLPHLGWAGVLFVFLFSLLVLPGPAGAAVSMVIPQVELPSEPTGHPSALEASFASESTELTDAIEAEAENEAVGEPISWAPLVGLPAQKLWVLSPAPTVLQRYAWPPIQVLQTRLELAFAARGPPRC